MKREDLQAILQLDPQVACEALLEMFQRLEARIALLEQQLGKNSSNSSKPPSSDGLKRTTSLRSNPQGRKRGAQPGHPGRTLERVPVADHVLELDHRQCPQCAQSLADVVAVGAERRQVFDLPPPRIEVTEYVAPGKRCPHCGCLSSPAFPSGVQSAVQYGPRFNAVMAHLHGTHLLPYARVAQLCADLYGHRPGIAAVEASLKRAARQMQDTVMAIGEALVRQAVVHADETAVRCEGHNRWVHVCSSPALTHLSFGGQRGAQGFEVAGLLPRLQGLLVHDFWSPYLKLECQHSYCNAHLLRELKAMKELRGHRWAGHLSAVLLEMKGAAQQAMDTAQKQVSATLRACLRGRYDRLVAKARQAHPKNQDRPEGRPRGRLKQSDEYSLLQRLAEHRDEVLRFLTEPGVPFDNNLAERDLRMLKVQQKISGCFRTREGAERMCVFRSYVGTAQKLGLNVLETITAAFQGRPFQVPVQAGT